LIEKRGRKTSTVKEQELFKNNTDQRVSNKAGNLIPAEYRKVFWTLLGSQDKWDFVFEKLIEAFDRAEAKHSQSQKIKEVQK
jgi:hypothetical protein